MRPQHRKGKYESATLLEHTGRPADAVARAFQTKQAHNGAGLSTSDTLTKTARTLRLLLLLLAALLRRG
jgi:hypothetical protein